MQFRRSDDHGASKRKEGRRRENGAQTGEAKGSRREKKEIAAARGTGKTQTALNCVVSLPIFPFADSRPFALHLEAEEVGHRALFPPIRSPPSSSPFSPSPAPLSAAARAVRGERAR